MSEETIPTTFDLTCNDGTIFTLPSNHPEINAGGIGGVSYNAILADPSQMPPQFHRFCTFTAPPPVEYVEPERIETVEGPYFDTALTKCARCDKPSVCIILHFTAMCTDCIAVEFSRSLAKVAEFGNP